MKVTFKGYLLVTSLCLFFDSCSKEADVKKPPTTPQYTLTVTAGKGGSVLPENTSKYNGETVVTITATPNEGYEFARWLGTDNDNKSNPCGKGRQLNKPISNCHITIKINSDMDVHAFFKANTD